MIWSPDKKTNIELENLVLNFDSVFKKK